MTRRHKKIEGEDDNSISDKAPPRIGGNIGPLKDDIKAASDLYNNILEQIQALHDDKNAIVSDLEAKGVDKKAFKKALSDSKQDKEKRDAYDESYEICREAMGFPLGHQFDAFTQPAAEAAQH